MEVKESPNDLIINPMYPCSGKSKGKKARCKKTVCVPGGFCDYHQDQKVEGNSCKCWLDGGSQCSFPIVENGLCQYHTQVSTCQSRLPTGEQCLRTIASGRQCNRCKVEGGPVLDSIKESAESIRHALMKQTGSVIVPFIKMNLVTSMSSDVTKLVIPVGLKHVAVDKPEDCPLCLDSMVGNYGTDHRKLKCGHYFHMDCLSKIYAMTCPLCRTAITESFLPKWVVERIKHNIENSEKERLVERERATVQLVREMQRQAQFEVFREAFNVPEELLEFLEGDMEELMLANN